MDIDHFADDDVVIAPLNDFRHLAFNCGGCAQEPANEQKEE